MSRQGPTLRLLVVCDRCEQLRRENGIGWATCLLYPNKTLRYIGDPNGSPSSRITIQPDWCPLASKREVTPAEDELRRQIPTALPEGT